MTQYRYAQVTLASDFFSKMPSLMMIDLLFDYIFYCIVLMMTDLLALWDSCCYYTNLLSDHFYSASVQ